MRTDCPAGVAHGLLRVALFIPSFGDGGVERDFVHTARGLAELGVCVDFVTAHDGGKFFEDLPNAVTRVALGGDATDNASYRHFFDYLRSRQPHVLISGKEQAHTTAIAARAEAGVGTQLIMRPGSIVSMRHRPARFWRRWRAYRQMRRTFRQADMLIAVSEGVARDTVNITGIAPNRIKTIQSPVITSEFFERIAAPTAHPWLVDSAQRDCPVLIAGGGLRRQKGFDELLRAFAVARASRPLRLIVMGQGRLRRSLERLASRLGIAADVDFAGFVENPYPLIAAADLFVLSSRFEGVGNVIVEAVAAGLPVVATDCPTGPREVLSTNQWSRLVPVGDASAMANAILETLEWPKPPVDELRESVRDYTLEVSAARYRDVLNTLASQP